jgi:hypothetical protein
VTVEGTSLTFTFADPEKTVRVFNLSDYPQAIRDRFAMHGMEQKLRDCYASKLITPAQAVGVQAKVNDSLIDGEWNAKGESAEPKVDSDAILAEALAMAYAAQGKVKTQAEMLTFVGTLDKSGKAKLRAKPSVAKALIDIKARTADDSLPE